MNHLFSRRPKKTSKLRVTGLCEDNPTATGGFPSQRAGNEGNVSVWWHHHVRRAVNRQGWLSTRIMASWMATRKHSLLKPGVLHVCITWLLCFPPASIDSSPVSTNSSPVSTDSSPQWITICLVTRGALMMTKWKHLPRYWRFVGGIHRSPVNSPHKGHWHRAFIFSLICAWTNSWVNNRDAGDLRLHRPHYHVTVMASRIFTLDCITSEKQGWVAALVAKNRFWWQFIHHDRHSPFQQFSS